jgi:hypothetical protein
VQNDGEPLANVTVRALQYKYANHGKRPMPVDKTITNDRGDYRLHNLLPGRYYIACSTNKARALKDNGKAFEGHYPLTFYPSVATLDKAVPLAIDAGNEVIANFLLMATRTYAIRGRISGVDPSPRATLEITTKAAMGDISIGVNVAENNTFGIKGLLPGSYRLLAHGVVSGNPGRGAKSTTIEESDLNDVLIEIGKAAKSLRGHIYVPPNARRDGVRVIVRLQPAITDDDEDNDLPAPVRNDDAMADLSGSFTGVTAERYTKTMFATVVASRPDSEDLFVARVRNDGQDVTGATVSLYPDDRRRIRPDLYHITRADQNGEFTIRGIAPGQYRIIAWEQVESAALNDPEFLTQYENQSVPLNIGPRLKYTVPLAVVPAEAERGIPGR